MVISVLFPIAARRSRLIFLEKRMDFDISDILFLFAVLSIVIMILNNDDWGGGRRSRVTADLPAPA